MSRLSSPSVVPGIRPGHSSACHFMEARRRLIIIIFLIVFNPVQMSSAQLYYVLVVRARIGQPVHNIIVRNAFAPEGKRSKRYFLGNDRIRRHLACQYSLLGYLFIIFLCASRFVKSSAILTSLNILKCRNPHAILNLWHKHNMFAHCFVLQNEMRLGKHPSIRIPRKPELPKPKHCQTQLYRRSTSSKTWLRHRRS